MTQINEAALDALFLKAHTENGFLPQAVDKALLKQAYDLAKMAPTSFNQSPMRIKFLTSSEAKLKLKPALMEGNVEKTMAAPVVAILASDMEFYNELPRLFPYFDAKPIFATNPTLAEVSAFRNSTLQAAYFTLALRAVGLQSGGMSGFDNAAVDEAFFKGTAFKANFLLNIGYGDASKRYPRAPRFAFEEVCTFA
jgi:3-hydroxypropanoate dehydrogenase